VYSDYPGGPVEGAIVSTSIDDVTAVTDVDGAFTLETDVRGDYCCDPYTISVSALDYQFWSESAIWGQDADVKVVLTYQYGARRTARVANR
jgi:hypothetical protein